MPLIRKLIKIGNSEGVTLPRQWLRYAADQQGQPVKHVAIEVNGCLKVSPYVKRQDQGVASK